MTKPFNWSYSHLKEFETCPRRYEVNKVLKLYPYEQSEEAKYGDDVHKALENYIRDGMPIPEKFSQFKPVADAMLRKPGRKHTELAMGVRRDLSPCGFFDKEVWLRGKGDIVVVDDEDMTAWSGDWKTGNNKYPDLDQMEVISLLIFAHFPHVRRVNSALIFIIKNTINKMRMNRDDAPKYWQRYIERAARIEASIAHGVFNPKSGPLCKAWCPVLTCEHNGKH